MPSPTNSLMETIVTMIDAFADVRGQNATFWIREINAGAYQIMIEPNSLAPMLRVGSPFGAAAEARAWIDNESASWLERFRRGM
jgi:hypothetical protein